MAAFAAPFLSAPRRRRAAPRRACDCISRGARALTPHALDSAVPLGMSCAIGGPPPGLVVVTHLRRAALTRAAPIESLALFTHLLPSLRRTVDKHELAGPSRLIDGPACLYLCADEADDVLIERTRELVRVARGRSPFAGVRLFFYPAAASPIREAAQQAYSDGARLVLHTPDDLGFGRAGWLRDAMGALRRRRPRPGLGFVLCRGIVANYSAEGRAAAVLVPRLHLDIFREIYPPQLPEHSLHDWLAQTYDEDALSGGGQGTGSSGGRLTGARGARPSGPCAARRHQPLPASGERANRCQLERAVQCGRAAVAAFLQALPQASPHEAATRAAPEWSPVSCLVADGA